MRAKKIQFKFREDSLKALRKDVVKLLKKEGVSNVHPLFPGETDRELASMYVVNCTNATQKKRVFKMLQSFEEVEFAEDFVQRKLIR